MKREVAVEVALESVCQIIFYCTDDAISEFSQYGDLSKYFDTPQKYTLHVDARFDFEEVVKYIEGYG